MYRNMYPTFIVLMISFQPPIPFAAKLLHLPFPPAMKTGNAHLQHPIADMQSFSQNIRPECRIYNILPAPDSRNATAPPPGVPAAFSIVLSR